MEASRWVRGVKPPCKGGLKRDLGMGMFLEKQAKERQLDGKVMAVRLCKYTPYTKALIFHPGST